MGLSVWHLLMVAFVILVLFGRGRIAGTMGDFGKGIKDLRNGMKGKNAISAPHAAVGSGLEQPDVSPGKSAKPTGN